MKKKYVALLAAATLGKRDDDRCERIAGTGEDHGSFELGHYL